MKLKFKSGTTSKRIKIFIQDASVTSNVNGLTGLVFNSAGLTWTYIRSDQATVTSITAVTATVGTFTTSGFIEVDSSLMPGVYELGIPNAALTGEYTHMMLFGATNMMPVLIELELDAVDYQDSIRFGMSALPNFSAGSTSGVPTVDNNNAVKVQSGTGSNQLNLSGGNVRLASDGFDNISTSIPTGIASTFREMQTQVWNRWYGMVVKDSNSGIIDTYHPSGNLATRQTYTSTGGIDTINKA